MKTNIKSLLAILFLTIGLQAQVDRSQQPKSGPAPIINLGKPQTFTLPNGLKVMVVEDKKLPRVSMNLTIDNNPYANGDKKGIEQLTGALIGEGTTKTPKDKFNEEVDFLGASLSFGSSGAYAYTLSRYFDRILNMMAEGALMPNFTQEELDKQRDQAIEGLKSEEKSASAIARRVSNVLSYGKSHPFGEFVTEETLKNVSLEDITSYYSKFFVPENAYLIVIGDVKFKEVKKQVTKLFGPWKSGTAPSVSYTDPSNVQFTQINLIDVPNAVQSEVSFVNTARLKMNDADYFPVLIANEILGGSFDSYLNMTLREKKAWTYGARSGMGASKNITAFRAGASLKMVATDSAVVEIIKQINRIRDERVSDEDLKNAKAAYVGNFVRQFSKPEAVSRYALTIQTQELPADFYENYLKNINAVSHEDVMRVAKKYFLTNNARIIVAAKAADVAEKLEKTGIPVLYFDAYGNQVAKPQLKKIPADMTVEKILNNYITAVGGMDALNKVKTVSMKGSGAFQGMTLEYAKKASTANKLFESLSMMGQAMTKVYDGKTGYQARGPQKMAIEGDDLKALQEEAHPFPEVNMLKANTLTIKGIETMNGSDAYALVAGDKTYFYDMTSGLKLGEAVKMNVQGQDMVMTTPYSDYKAVKGVLFPHKTAINVGVEIEINITEVKVNEGVTEADFK